MALVDEARAGGEFRKLLQLTADEVMPGDLMRDQGVLRSVSHVTPSPADWALVVHFEPVAQYCPDLTVPLFQLVTVRRVCGDQ